MWSLRRDEERGSLTLVLLVPQLSASKLFIIQSIIFSLFWTPVQEMKRQTARAVFLHLRSGKHDLLRLHSPPKHTPPVPTCFQEIHTHRQTDTPESCICIHTYSAFHIHQTPLPLQSITYSRVFIIIMMINVSINVIYVYIYFCHSFYVFMYFKFFRAFEVFLRDNFREKPWGDIK